MPRIKVNHTFLKCSDPDDTHHNISVNDALKLDEILLKKSKGTPLFDVINTHLHSIINELNISSVLMSIGGRIGDVMDLTETAIDPKSDSGSSLSKKEKDDIHKAIALLEEKIKKILRFQ